MDARWELRYLQFVSRCPTMYFADDAHDYHARKETMTGEPARDS